MKRITVLALAAILTFAIAVSAQTTSDTPADQPQATTDTQPDQTQAPAAQPNDDAAPAEAAPAAEASPTAEAAPMGDSDSAAEVSAENGAWILEPSANDTKSVSTMSDEAGQTAATTSESFPDFYY